MSSSNRNPDFQEINPDNVFNQNSQEQNTDNEPVITEESLEELRLFLLEETTNSTGTTTEPVLDNETDITDHNLNTQPSQQGYTYKEMEELLLMPEGTDPNLNTQPSQQGYSYQEIEDLLFKPEGTNINANSPIQFPNSINLNTSMNFFPQSNLQSLQPVSNSNTPKVLSFDYSAANLSNQIIIEVYINDENDLLNIYDDLRGASVLNKYKKQGIIITKMHDKMKFTLLKDTCKIKEKQDIEKFLNEILQYDGRKVSVTDTLLAEGQIEIPAALRSPTEDKTMSYSIKKHPHGTALVLYTKTNFDHGSSRLHQAIYNKLKDRISSYLTPYVTVLGEGSCIFIVFNRASPYKTEHLQDFVKFLNIMLNPDLFPKEIRTYIEEFKKSALAGVNSTPTTISNANTVSNANTISNANTNTGNEYYEQITSDEYYEQMIKRRRTGGQ